MKEKKEKEPYVAPDRPGYRTVDLTTRFGMGNILGTVLAAVLFGACAGIAFLLFGHGLMDRLDTLDDEFVVPVGSWIVGFGVKAYTAVVIAKILYVVAWVLFIMLLSFIHEVIHVSTWAIFLGKNRKKGMLSMGIHGLTPYARCSCDTSVPGTFWGALMPMIVLGLIPFIIACIIGSPLLAIEGAFGLSAGGGDLLSGAKMVKYLRVKGAVAADSPERLGCVVYIPESA